MRLLSFPLLLAACVVVSSCSVFPSMGSPEAKSAPKQYTISSDGIGSFLAWVGSPEGSRNAAFYYKLGALLWEYPNDPRLLSLLDEEKSPLVLVSIMVDHKMDAWQRSPLPDSGGDLGFEMPQPVVLTKPAVLYRGEFESELEFSSRASEAMSEYLEAQEIEDLLYKRRLVEYEEVVAYHNELVSLEKSRRNEAYDVLRLRFLQQALSIVGGDLYVTEPRYDVDSGTLFLLLATTRTALEKTISFVVPVEAAKQMVLKLNELSPKLSIYWGLNGDLVLSNQVAIEFDGVNYLALTLDYSDIPSLKPVRIN